MTPPREDRRYGWWGFAAGLALGGADLALAQVLGMQVVIGGRDLTVFTMFLFGVTYAAFGYVIGRLYESRRVIRAQVAELRASQEALVESERLASIGQLSAGVAHEVRNPLAVIRSAAGLLGEVGDLADPDATRALALIREESDRLDGFVRELLDLTRPVEVRPEEVRVGEALARAARLGTRQGGPDLEVEAPGDLTHEVDPELLVRALVPLVANASDPEHGATRVRVRAEVAGAGLRIEVADDGAGLPDADAPRVFEPFFTTRAAGTGLGVPMAARLSGALGGALAHVPGAGLGPGGRGACFRLEVPPGAGGRTP